MKRAKTKTERSSLMNVGRRVDYVSGLCLFLPVAPPGRLLAAQILKRAKIFSVSISVMKDLVGRDLSSCIWTQRRFSLAKLATSIRSRTYTRREATVLMDVSIRNRLLFLLFCLYPEVDLGGGSKGSFSSFWKDIDQRLSPITIN